ncbi:MAG: M48 family metalloprotease [Leptolyngbya sp. SIO1E4]|nr:M48 family metalloprotease [Leptolyngbya sp. SIO1E4]
MKTTRTIDRRPRLLYRWLYPAWAAVFSFSPVFAVPYAKADMDIFDLIFQGVRIIQLSNLADEQEIALGQQINQQILQDVKVFDGSSITQYIDGIGQQLVPGTDRAQIPYPFQVVDDDQVDAFATVGGFVYLNTGLLRAADNEAQRASVIAHEIAHVDLRYAIQQLQQAAIAQGTLTAGGLDHNTAISLGVELALHHPNSRTHKLEADEVGLVLLTQAGYAPIAAVDFLQKLLDQPNTFPDFLSTHPHPEAEARINALNEQLDPAMASTGWG